MIAIEMILFAVLALIIVGIVALAVMSGNYNKRMDGIRCGEISPDDARIAYLTIKEYTARHDNCRACVFAKVCGEGWKKCPVDWGDPE